MHEDVITQLIHACGKDPDEWEGDTEDLCLLALSKISSLIEQQEHQWVDGPDGIGYHCSRCGISKCDDHDCYSTCLSHLERREHIGTHAIINGFERLLEPTWKSSPED